MKIAIREFWAEQFNWRRSESLAQGESETQQTASPIKPRAGDVAGVYTEDFNLQGAVEFAEHVQDDIFLVHLIAATERDRQLRAGDRLFGRYSGLIGQTKITAERCLFEVLEVGEQPIPLLNTDRD
ncbi:hypothetical protein NA78x_005580 [Anatilimnocola sp. NA78]|uniref:hypothetical protein n=1 Tax=Anatilimnocola sp. NA78 TaxID=3415683 RepID=UPI003CE4E87B